MATVQQIYIAIFGRPADPVGLAYWNEQTNNGADLSAMIAAFTAAPEYEARFEGQSNEEIISSIYQSLFGREPDDEGLEFYAEALANGELPIETIAVRILDGAQNEDQTSIENKTEAADKFTTSIDTPEEIEAYQGTQAATEAQEFLETVNEDPESVPSDEDVDQAVKEVNEGDYNPPEEEPEVPGPGPDPQTELTTGKNDNVVGTSADDVFIGRLGDEATFNTGDSVDGRDGYDALILQIANDGATLPGTFSVENVEFVGFVSGEIVEGEVRAFAPDIPKLGGSLDASLFEDVPHLAQAGASVDIANLGEDQTAIFAAHDVQASVSAAGNTAQVGLDLWGHVSTLTFDGEDLRTVSVSTFDEPFGESDDEGEGSSDPDARNLNLKTTSTGVTEVQIALKTSQKVNLDSGFADTLETFDASGSTGSINVDFVDIESQLQDIKAGDGDDTVTTSAAALVDDVSISGGDGDDTLVVDLEGYTFGDGIDTVGAGLQEFDYTNVGGFETLAFERDVVLDSNPSGDVLDLTGTAFTSLVMDADIGLQADFDLNVSAAFDSVTLNGSVTGGPDHGFVIDGTDTATIKINADFTANLTADSLISATLNVGDGATADIGEISAAALVDLDIDLGADGILVGPTVGDLAALETYTVSGGADASVEQGFGAEAALSEIDLSEMAGNSTIRVHDDGDAIGVLDILIGEGDLQYGTAGITSNDDRETFSFVGGNIGNVEIYNFTTDDGADADRLDFSAFDGVDDVDDLVITADGDDTLIDAKDDEFTGTIRLVGVTEAAFDGATDIDFAA